MLRDQMPNLIEGIVVFLLQTNAASAAAAIAHRSPSVELKGSPTMNRPLSVRSRPSPGLWRGLFKEFTRAIWAASRERNAESQVRRPQSNLPLSHPASSLPPLPGSHAAGLVPRAGRTLYSPTADHRRNGHRRLPGVVIQNDFTAAGACA